MNGRERFLRVINFKNVDRLPFIEWAAWWDKTIDNWNDQGLPQMTLMESLDYFGLDKMLMISAEITGQDCPIPVEEGKGIITDEQSYKVIRKYLYPQSSIEKMIKNAIELKKIHDDGEIIIRLWLDGFFWFPRKLLGIENHMYAFYDDPALIHRMNEDLTNFHIQTIDALCSILTPDMAGFAEDMSYNLGPMLSYECYQEFILPYYKKVVPTLKKHGIKVFVDSDGKIEDMIPWLLEGGIEGIYPLERQSGVDINQIRKDYPDFLMLGGYNKMVMTKGEQSMRKEFERILPVMRSGGYIPSVDHQTPPGVTLENYQIYVKLLKEYCIKAVE